MNLNLDPTSQFMIAYGSGLMGTRGGGGFGRAGLMGLDAMQATKRMQLLEAENARREAADALERKKVEAALAEAERSKALRAAWVQKVTGGTQARQSAAERAAQPPSFGPVDPSPQADVANIIRNANIANDRAQAAQQANALPYTYDEGVQAELLGIDPKATDRLKEMAVGWEQKPGAGYRNPRTGRLEFTPDPKEGIQMVDGRVVGIPGAVEEAARRAGAVAEAEAAAKAGYDFVEMLDKRPGSPTQGQIIQVPKRSMPGAGPGGVASAVPPAAPQPARVPPAAQYQRDQERLRLLEDERAAAQNPADIAALDREIAATRAQLRRLGATPPSASPDASGGLVSPKQAERDSQAGKDAARVQEQRATTDSIQSTIDDAVSLIGITSTGAIGAAMRRLPAATDAGALDNAVKTIKANLGFDRLQVMRENSPTGGALGQVAVQELDMLQSTIQTLDPVRDGAERTRNKLLKIKQHYDRWLSLREQGYREKYGRPAPAIDFGAAGQDGIDSLVNRWAR